MQLAQLPGVAPGVSPFETLQIASGHLQDAQQQLTISPNVRMDAAAMITGAGTAAQRAVTILRPLTDGGDIFTRRNAMASITAASDGLALLRRAFERIVNDGSEPSTEHAPSPAGLMEQAKDKFRIAESALWME